jgi:signal transduction histidine kinase
VFITAANLTLIVVLAAMARHAVQPGFTVDRLVGFSAGFGLVGLIPMRLDYGRQQATFTLSAAVLVTAFFAMGPMGVALAAALGEALACTAQRVQLLKTLFNVASKLAAAGLAGMAFAALGGATAGEVRGWAVALVSTLCYSILNLAAVTGVLSRAEERKYEQIVLSSGPTSLGTTLAAAPLGLIALDLLNHGPLAPVLLAPLVLAVVLNNRSAASQRDEHLRVERLYEATSRMARLTTSAEAIQSMAIESRLLLTGAASLCCLQTKGSWSGVVVDDDGTRAATRSELDGLVGLVQTSGPGELACDEAPALLGQIAPAASRVLFACSPVDGPLPVALAVFRSPLPQEGVSGPLATLIAFAAQGTLTIGNALLYEEVEEAFHQQVDLNRQKDEFVAAVSHELRTPLAGMLGAVETTLRHINRLSDEDRDRLLRMSLDQGKRLTRLIEDLLLVAAAEHAAVLAVDEINLKDLLDGVAEELVRIGGNRLQVGVVEPTEVVWSDEHRVHQVVVNLVENAAKYSPTGAIDLQAWLSGPQAFIAVSDHGPGIPEVDRERVFERFVQLDQSSTRRQGGTGLGLYLCRQLASQLGGRLTLTETAGGGCTFTLAVEAKAAVGPDAPRSEPVTIPGMARRPEHLSVEPPGPTNGVAHLRLLPAADGGGAT